MYTIKEFFDDLAWGDFKHIKIGNSTLGSISAADYPMIISMINFGMTELHKRFDLKKGTLYLQQDINVEEYIIRPDFCVTSDSIEPVKYIMDSEAKPFKDDLMKITALFDEEGTELPIGDPMATYPIFRPEFDILEMVPFSPPQMLKLTYRRDHPKIVVSEGFDPTAVTLNLQRSFHDALASYVAARVFTGMDPQGKKGGQETPNSPHWYRFELACKKCEVYNMDDDDNEVYDKLHAKGFV